MVGQHPTDELAPQLGRIGTGIVGHAGEHDEATIWSHQNPPAADIMPMQIGAVRNATKPSSSAKAFSIENLPLRGTRAVDCYMVHGKIRRAIYRRLYVFFKFEFVFRNTGCAIYRKLDCHAQFLRYQGCCTNQRVSPSALIGVS
jgi:hypothetical protein